MKKILGVICKARGLMLSIIYNIETEGHFFKEVKAGHFTCKLCGDKTRSLSLIKK